MSGPIRHDFNKLNRLPPYIFAQVTSLMAAARKAGEDIIDLGMGNPDLATPPHVVEKICEAARNPRNHRYSTSRGPAPAFHHPGTVFDAVGHRVNVYLEGALQKLGSQLFKANAQGLNACIVDQDVHASISLDSALQHQAHLILL